MSYTIDNRQDIMDTRDVLEHLRSLEDDDARKPWVAGWNLPGHLPDEPYQAFATFQDAKDFLVEELESRFKSVFEDSGADEKDIAEAQQQIETTITDLQSAPLDKPVTVDNGDYVFCIEPNDDFEPELAEEYAYLTAFVEEIEGYCTMKDGETLIREDHFEEYAQQLAGEICDMKQAEGWPFRHIDWEAAAEELKIDYTTADFDGVTYYFRTH